MADLNLTSPITDGDQVTAQTLHDLIETATISGLTAADLAEGVQVSISQASPPSPSNYSFWFETNHHDPVLRTYFPAFGLWLAVGPDRFEYPMKVLSGTVPKGACLAAAGASAAQIATNVSLNWAGFAQDTGTSGSWVPVSCMGIGWIAATPAADFASLDTFTALGAAAGKVRALNWNSASAATSALALGVLLDHATGAGWSGATLHGFRAVIWGPKSPTGFGE